MLYCLVCESPTITITALGYIANDGTTGTVEGLACNMCGSIAERPDAVAIPDGGHVDLAGMTPTEWLLSRLRAGGCPTPEMFITQALLDMDDEA